MAQPGTEVSSGYIGEPPLLESSSMKAQGNPLPALQNQRLGSWKQFRMGSNWQTWNRGSASQLRSPQATSDWTPCFGPPHFAPSTFLEVAVPWDDSVGEAYEAKRLMYTELVADA